MVSKDELVNAIQVALQEVSKGDESTTLLLTASSEEVKLGIVIPVIFEALVEHPGVGQIVCGNNREATGVLVSRLEDPDQLSCFADIALLGQVDTITLVKRHGDNLFECKETDMSSIIGAQRQGQEAPDSEVLAEYMRVVLGLKQLLGEKWYRKSISTLSRRKPTNGLIEILVNSVCRIVKPDPDDEKSVSIYAILTNETKEQARARMLKSGLGQSKR